MVCPASLLVLPVELAIYLAVIPAHFLVFFGIFYFGGFLVGDLSQWVVEVGLLVYRFIPNCLGVLAGDYDSTSNLAVVGIMCLVTTYPTLVVG